MGEGQFGIEVGLTLAERKELIDSKIEAMRALFDEMKRLNLTYKDIGPNDVAARKQWHEDHDRNQQAQRRITGQFIQEIQEFASFRRIRRLKNWPAWWNLWIGGFIVALIWNALEILWEFALIIGRYTNNPEKVFDMALKVADILEDMQTPVPGP